MTETELKVEGFPQKSTAHLVKKLGEVIIVACLFVEIPPANQSRKESLGLEKHSFYSFPDQKTLLAKEWIARIRHDVGPSFRITKRSKICSVHSNPDDFYHGEFDIQTTRQHLKPTAVLSIFPWTIRILVVYISYIKHCFFTATEI